LARETADGGPAMLIGLPWVEDGKLYNAYALLNGGRVEAIRFKVNLPNYGVFDEKRVFATGPVPGPISFRGVRIGIPICEDTWTDWGDYENVIETLAETGAELFVVPNGSPYWRGKSDVRLNVVVARVTESGLPLIYVNQVGGQDELVFDGASFGINADCSVAFQLPAFTETVVTTQWSRNGNAWRCAQGPMAPPEQADKADYAACVLGLRDYVEKNRFKSVVLGLSGGIDSALCAAMATDALGADRVRCVMLPYRYTSKDSLDDAAAIAKTLGVNYAMVPIESAVKGLETALAGIFAGAPRDVTEENLQARARGTILMAVSNKFGAMVVTTGNKSEMSVGYATLYGDMNGGFNPIKDLYKTEVYRLSRLRNVWKPDDARGPAGQVIPENVITRAPSAELRENQTDQDSLPPYDVLDQILERLVEREQPTAAIIAAGFDRDTVMKIERMLYLAEYKRRQAAPGVKVTLKNFGRDRRYPIVNRFHDPGKPLPEPGRTAIRGVAIGKAADF
jgi:NAD+ synthase